MSRRLEFDDVPEEMADDDTARGATGWTGAGFDEWELRLEAETLLKE